MSGVPISSTFKPVTSATACAPDLGSRALAGPEALATADRVSGEPTEVSPLTQALGTAGTHSQA